MTRGVAIATAVVAELNSTARAWATQFVASREWAKVYKIEELQTLKVAVVAATLGSDKADRRPENKEAYRIIIDFQKHVATDPTSEEIDNDACDALDVIAEQVFDFYQDFHYLTTTVDRSNGAGGTWKVMAVERPDLFDFAYLMEERIWETQIYLMVQGTI